MFVVFFNRRHLLRQSLKTEGRGGYDTALHSLEPEAKSENAAYLLRALPASKPEELAKLLREWG